MSRKGPHDPPALKGDAASVVQTEAAPGTTVLAGSGATRSDDHARREGSFVAECSACARPAPDAVICPSCTGQAAAYLRQVPWLVEQLTVTLTRQARMGERNGPRGRESPVVFHEAASEDLEIIRELMGRWSRAVSEHRGVSVDAGPDPTGLSRWLLRWNGAAAQHPDAADYLTELHNAVRGSQRAIDRAPELRYVGPCEDCAQDLYVLAERPPATVVCPTAGCEGAYPMEERRAWLLEQTYDRLLTANEMSRAIAALVPGQHLTPNLISQWAKRDKITKYLPHPRDPHKRVRFRVEDVINQLRASMEGRKASA